MRKEQPVLPEVVEEPVVEPEIVVLKHDDILRRLETIDWKAVPRAVPLDTTESRLFVYGKDHREYVSFIHSVRSTLLKHHTLVRKEIRDARIPYSQTTFFVTDGYYDDTVSSLQSVVGACHEFVTDYKQLHQFAGKSREDIHNLRLCDDLLDDILSLVEKLKSDRNLSTHKNRRAARNPGGDLEEDTPRS